MMYKAKFLFIFLLFFSLELFAESAIFINSPQDTAERGKARSKQSGLNEEGMVLAMPDEEDRAGKAAARRKPKTQLVVALPFRPGEPFDAVSWYTPAYVDYIASLLPVDRYEVSGYFVCFENIPQFLDDMEKLKEKGDVIVLNICDGGEWDGYVGISLCRFWEEHPINGKIAKSGADYQFILNSDDKIIMQTFLKRANLKPLAQTLISRHQLLEEGPITEILAQAGLSWPLFCKLNIGAGAVGIDDASICHTMDQLLVHLQKMQAEYANNDIIVQPYLPGPEYTVLVLGDRIYAAVRRDFHNTYNVMYEDYLTGSRSIEEEITYLPAPEHVQKIAVEAIKAIPGRHHYTRVDLRDDVQGNTYVIDINERPGFGIPSTLNCMLDFHHLSTAQFVLDIVETSTK